MLTPSESSAFARLCTEMKPCVRPHVSWRHPLPWLPPGVSLALCPARGPAALQRFLDLLSHLEVPGLRQRSSRTEATETKSIFSFRKKTPQIARVYFPLPWGQELSRAAAQAQTALCTFPWGSGAAPTRFMGFSQHRSRTRSPFWGAQRRVLSSAGLHVPPCNCRHPWAHCLCLGMT